MNNLFIVVNVDTFFLSHRKEIAVEAQGRGFNVTVIAHNTGKKAAIEELGLAFVDFPLSGVSKNIFKELRALLFLVFIYNKMKPDIVHHVGLKPILYGTLAAKYTRIKGVLNAVSGLGIPFSQDNPALFKSIILKTFRFVHRHKNVAVVFQNDEDKALFLGNDVIKESQAYKIKGSGIDLRIFSMPQNNDDSIINILFAARMIREKGVLELVEAANILRKNHYNRIRFLLCGDIVDNPKSLTREELKKISDGHYIVWLGYRTDMRKLLEQSHIVAFPSYYREGVPKSLIEACAVGRPIVTTDSTGCRDTVIDGYNGFLVPIKDSKALAEKLEALINNRSLRMLMGKNSRKLAEENFAIEDVVEKHLEIYNELLSKINS
jgi:glycosyltransferase involved in cell wall biosynthesis